MTERIPPSWEVLDEEARALGLEISYEVEQDTGKGYVNYTGNGMQLSYLDHPEGRISANDRFSKLREGAEE